jgi:hypothetical protein
MRWTRMYYSIFLPSIVSLDHMMESQR